MGQGTSCRMLSLSAWPRFSILQNESGSLHHFHVSNAKLHTEGRKKSHKGTACISLRQIPTHSLVLSLPHMETPLRPGRPLCSHIFLPLPLLYYYYFFLLAEAALSPLQEDTVPTHLLEEVSSHGPHSAPSSSRVCPASTDTCYGL